LICVKKSSVLDCETFRKTLCYTAMIIGISGFIVYNFGFEENNISLGSSFATTTNSGIANSSQNTTTTSSSTNTSLTEATDTIEELVKSEITSATFSGANTSSLDSLKSNSINQGGSDDLLLSDPFYTSKSSKVLNKLSLHPASDSTSTKELQIFYELGLIHNLEAVHNIGYYVEGSKSEVDLNKPSVDNQNTDASSSSIDNHVKFAKGTGFYVATDADIIGWNAYDQVFNYSDDVTKYLGIIYFSTNEIPGGKLSELNYKVGIYEYDLYSNGSAIRNIWLWPSTAPITTQTDINTINGNSNSSSSSSSSSSRYLN
jgi:hypothetical protein